MLLKKIALLNFKFVKIFTYAEYQFLNRIDRIYYFILSIPFKSTSPLKIVFHSSLSLNHSVFFLLLWFLSCPYLYLIHFTTGTTYFVQSCIFWLHTHFPASHLKSVSLAIACLALLSISRVFSTNSPSSHLTNIDYFFWFLLHLEKSQIRDIYNWGFQKISLYIVSNSAALI